MMKLPHLSKLEVLKQDRLLFRFGTLFRRYYKLQKLTPRDPRHPNYHRVMRLRAQTRDENRKVEEKIRWGGYTYDNI